jgi:hypothetical protein
MKTQQELIDDLKALGESEQEIYSNLLSQGCKGIRMEETYCPIAMYLKNKGYDSPSVDADCIYTNDVDMDDSMGGVCPEQPLRSFIQDFDSGLYPDLECAPIQPKA